MWWRCTNEADGYEWGLDYSIVGVENGFFNRIGQYDFKNPENPKKIERLNNYSNWNSTDAKINELIDAVNELREKLN